MKVEFVCVCSPQVNTPFREDRAEIRREKYEAIYFYVHLPAELSFEEVQQRAAQIQTSKLALSVHYQDGWTILMAQGTRVTALIRQIIREWEHAGGFHDLAQVMVIITTLPLRWMRIIPPVPVLPVRHLSKSLSKEVMELIDPDA